MTFRDTINAILNNWNFHRDLTLDILENLSEEQLNLTVGKNMGTLGAQFRHIGRVQTQYIEAIENKKLGKIQEEYKPEIAKSKKELLDYLQNTNERMMGFINNMNDEELQSLKIDWTYWKEKEMNLAGHLTALINHINLHNGQIIVYLRTHDIPFPKSWAAWGL